MLESGPKHCYSRADGYIIFEKEKGLMPGIKARDGEPVEKLLRIFKKQVEKAGVLGDLRKYEYFEKPSIRRKKKSIAARKRHIKQMRKMGTAE